MTSRAANVFEFRRVNMHGTKSGPGADPDYHEKYHPGSGGSSDRFKLASGNKIVDEDGNPKTVYHASWVERDFENDKREDTAIFFSDRPRHNEFGNVVHEANIYMENPLDARWGGVSDYDADSILMYLSDKDIGEIVGEQSSLGLWADEDYVAADSDVDVLRDWMVGDSDFSGGFANWYNYPSIRKAIKRAGFDGIMGNDSFGGSIEYIVFDTDQIRVINVSRYPRGEQ